MEPHEILASVVAGTVATALAMPIAWQTILFPHDSHRYLLLLPLLLLILLPPLTSVSRVRKARSIRVLQASVYAAALLTPVSATVWAIWLFVVNIGGEEPGIPLIIASAIVCCSSVYVAFVAWIDRRKFHGWLARKAKWLAVGGVLPPLALITLAFVGF
jgi:hypothetical protein